MSAAPAALSAHDPSLAAGLKSLGLSLSDEARAKLDAYVALLAKWNRTYNLTAIRERIGDALSWLMQSGVMASRGTMRPQLTA